MLEHQNVDIQVKNWKMRPKNSKQIILKCWTLICWKSTWIELRYFDPSKMTIFWKKDWGEFRDFSSCDKFVFILTTALKLVRIVKWQLLIYFYLTQIKRNLELNFKANVFWAFFSNFDATVFYFFSCKAPLYINFNRKNNFNSFLIQSRFLCQK